MWPEPKSSGILRVVKMPKQRQNFCTNTYTKIQYVWLYSINYLQVKFVRRILQKLERKKKFLFDGGNKVLFGFEFNHPKWSFQIFETDWVVFSNIHLFNSRLAPPWTVLQSKLFPFSDQTKNYFVACGHWNNYFPDVFSLVFHEIYFLIKQSFDRHIVSM